MRAEETEEVPACKVHARSGDDQSQVSPNWHTLGDRVSTYNWPFHVAKVKSDVAAAAHEAGFIQ